MSQFHNILNLIVLYFISVCICNVDQCSVQCSAVQSVQSSRVDLGDGSTSMIAPSKEHRGNRWGGGGTFCESPSSPSPGAMVSQTSGGLHYTTEPPPSCTGHPGSRAAASEKIQFHIFLSPRPASCSCCGLGGRGGTKIIT